MDFAELQGFLIVITIFLIIGVGFMVGIFVILLMMRDEHGMDDGHTITIDYSQIGKQKESAVSEAYKVMCVKCRASSSERWFTVGKEYTVRRSWPLKCEILKDDQGFNWNLWDYMINGKEIELNGYLFYKLN